MIGDDSTVMKTRHKIIATHFCRMLVMTPIVMAALLFTLEQTATEAKIECRLQKEKLHEKE